MFQIFFRISILLWSLKKNAYIMYDNRKLKSTEKIYYINNPLDSLSLGEIYWKFPQNKAQQSVNRFKDIC